MNSQPRVVVTGGGRGVGAALALRIAARGGHVVIAARTQSELDDTARDIATRHGASRVRAIRCDVSRAADVGALCSAAVEFLGDVDLLVNNAGIARRVLAHEMQEAAWDEVLDVNLKGAFLCAHAFLPAMLARKHGRIVNVASISATLGTAKMTAYCASKWGLVGFTKALAEETRDGGVQVIAVLPGSIDTAMLVGSDFPARMSADEVARTIEWLGIDAPDAMTGAAVEMFG